MSPIRSLSPGLGFWTHLYLTSLLRAGEQGPHPGPRLRVTCDPHDGPLQDLAPREAALSSSPPSLLSLLVYLMLRSVWLAPLSLGVWATSPWAWPVAQGPSSDSCVGAKPCSIHASALAAFELLCQARGPGTEAPGIKKLKIMPF